MEYIGGVQCIRGLSGIHWRVLSTLEGYDAMWGYPEYIGGS